MSLNVEFLPTDRITIDGAPYRYLGNSAEGYLFVGTDNEETVREVLATDLWDLACDPGRFSLEPEFFKKREKRK